MCESNIKERKSAKGKKKTKGITISSLSPTNGGKVKNNN